jgi:hypothetical protein
MELQIQDHLSAADLSPGIRVVAAMAPDPGLPSLAAGAPQVQFLAIGIPGLQPGPNLSLITAPETFASQQAFLAGYITALATPDWRAGILSLRDASDGEKATEAFTNGARFFCGLCKPAYPPFVNYPAAAAADSPLDWRPAADALLALSVKTVYIFPGASSPDLLDYLAKARVRLIGGQAPPETIQSLWIATIRFSAAGVLRKAWPELVAGHGNQNLVLALVLEDISSGALPAARQRLVQEILDNLTSGKIAPGLVPEP